MAKHIIGKNKSNATRISCKGNVKKAAAIMAPVERVATAMRDALLNIRVESAVVERSTPHHIIDAILNCAKRNVGNNSVGRGWTANLSPKTVRTLTEQGVFA